jgi:Domain of unknown function (DUF4386)
MAAMVRKPWRREKRQFNAGLPRFVAPPLAASGSRAIVGDGGVWLAVLEEILMSSPQRIGRLLGLMMLLHLALGLIGPYVVLVPMNSPPGGFLEHAAGMAAAIRVSVLVLVVGGLIPVAMATLAWPHWRGPAAALGLWLVLLAGVNFALQMVENAHWLTLLSASEAFEKAKPGAVDTFRLMATSMGAAFKWAHYTHVLVLVAWLFTLYVTLHRCRAVPNLLTAAGIAACLLHMAGIPLPEFLGYRLQGAAFYGIPLAIVYLSTGAWLLWKGFRGVESPPSGAESSRI